MSAAERFDAVILGAGPGGEVALNTLAKEDLRIALLEENVIGGECSNWGCIPTKTLLRPTELKGKSMRAAGVMTPALQWPELSAYRNYMVSDHDDSKRIAAYEARGITVVKERGRIAGPGRVEANGRVLKTDRRSPAWRRPATGRIARRPTSRTSPRAPWSSAEAPWASSSPNSSRASAPA
jgi:dihydrolipoamide dehydrogenase